MPTQKIVTLYEYDELPTEEAKEAARNWFKEADTFNDYVDYDDFIAICAAMGVDVGTEAENYGNGKTRNVPAISWTGFWSQGDGASFTGTFKLDGTAGAKIRDYAPQDEKLHAIADAFDVLHTDHPGLSGTITRDRGFRYSHEYTMDVDLTDRDMDDDDLTGWAAVEDKAQDLCRDLARWLYRSLEAEYEYRNSDEEVAESIRINDYTFTEDGKRED